MSQENPPHQLVNRLLYAALFIIVLPVALALWAHGTRNFITAQPLSSPVRGAALAALGVFIMLSGMLALWRRGGGLPMNAFPPPRFVSSGIYSLVPHPIYVGFVMACAGVAVFTGSASGLWLVTPIVTLACAALVLGYELPDLRNRFGAPAHSLWLPHASSDAPTLIERLRIYIVVLLPWFAIFELIGYFGKAPDAIQTYFGFERNWPIIEPWEPIYASTYAVVLLTPVLIRSAQQLRRFAQRGLTAMAFIFPLYLLLPFFVPPRPFHASTAFAPLLLWERTPISSIGAFPSFHVVWAFIAASVLSEGSRFKRATWWTWAFLVAMSCVLTGMHSIADVCAGLAAFLLVVNMPRLWNGLLRLAEQLANSWIEWRIGPVRIINHGAYAGAAAVTGIFIIDTLLGPGGAFLSLSICVCAMLGAALWAQWVEGSPALLRPLGFYGGMLGSMVGAIPALFLHINLWGAFAAICVAAPWIQGLGRLRCLVQGCCHGCPTQIDAGIRYTHPRSRVCRLAHLPGVPVHATPVYSILCNIFIGAALIRLVQLHTPAAFICGMYLILSGCGRFVEEAYRGEPQTHVFAGMRLYQWIAVLCVVTGAALTCIPGSPVFPAPGIRLSSLVLALACGVLAWFISGVDFPESSRRFARLT
jgi:protein-S-isoprenylcysteine O-methyltransferase Ste14